MPTPNDYARSATRSRAVALAGQSTTAKQRLLFGGALLIALAWGATHAHAQSIFTCKDDKGRVLTSDRPIPECATKSMREVSAAGVVKNEFAPPLTKEQIALKKVEDEQRRIADLKRRQEDARDKALMIAYPNMKALDSDRERQLADLRSEITLVEARMAKEHQVLKAAQAELNKQGANANFAVKRKVQGSAAAILADSDIRERMRRDIARTEQRFDEDQQRLRHLLNEPETARAPKPTTPIASR